MRAWYLIYTKPRQERTATANLERQGFETYLPMVRVRRRRGGRTALSIEPMFPHYVFVRLSDTSDDWGPIRSTLGVSHLVRFGQQAAVVPEELVAALGACEDEEGFQPLPTHTFREGDPVRIVDGLMAGYEAVFSARTSRERVLVLLEITDSAAQIQVDADQIEPVRPGGPHRPTKGEHGG